MDAAFVDRRAGEESARTVANCLGSPDHFIVGILEPRGTPGWAKPDWMAIGLGIVSLLTALGALGLVRKDARRSC